MQSTCMVQKLEQKTKLAQENERPLENCPQAVTICLYQKKGEINSLQGWQIACWTI